MSSRPSLEDRIEGCFLGLAIGDALGYPTEFLSYQEIQMKFGPQGIQDLQGQPALHSDDTQLSISVGQALIKACGKSFVDFMEELCQQYLLWFRSPENDRAPGNTTIRGCQNLESGIHWTQSGILQSKGCGANMRVAPIGLFHSKEPQQLRQVARASALVTHGHPTALIAAEATAFCISWAMEGIQPTEYLERITAMRSDSVSAWEDSLGDIWNRAQFVSPQDYLEEGWRQLLNEMEKVPQVVEKSPIDLCSIAGGGWVAEDALACALACVLLYPEDYASAVKRGANSGGDSDSIGSIAGAISGALLGVNAIPKEWRKRIESRNLLLELARKFAAELQR